MFNWVRIELEFCQKTTQKLYEHPLSKLFLQPVNPELDGVPDYFQKIKKPMDLGTIKSKLNSNDYKNSKEWLEDVYLVWQNAKNYHPKSSSIYRAAELLKKKTDKMVQTIPKDEIENWSLKLNKINSKIQALLKNPPSENCFVPIKSVGK
jgi:protein subunit release factor A